MKKVLNFVKLFLVILLVSLTSCTNDLSEKDSQMSFSFTLPQEKVIRTTGDNNESTLLNVTAVIENKKDIIQKIEQSGYSGETVTITFNQIIIGQKVRINIDLTQDGETTPSYTGSSDWFIVKKDENKINIALSKVEIILPVDAALPKLNTNPESIVEIATSGSTETITKTLSVNATSTDCGTLSFIWQEKKDNNEWTPYTPIKTTTDNDNTTCSIDVTVVKGQVRTFRCIITNTNNSVNGNKTATIETNEVKVAYVEGTLSEITAQYTGQFETFESRPYNSVEVKETYTSGSKTTDVTVPADAIRYTIEPKNDNEKAIGYVPYTVKYNDDANVTTEIRVPVKYQLSAGDFVITSTTNEIGNSTSSNPEKIAQFIGNTTLQVKTSATSNIPNKIYKDENSATAEDYVILEKLQSEWKLENQQITDTAVNNAVATSYNYTNTLTVPTENSWCVGDPIELEYYVQVCPWTLAVKQNSSIIDDLANLTGGTTYTLSATNDADSNSNVIWESNNDNFEVNNSTLTTPEATTNNQTATITAKVGGIEIGTLNVIVQKQEPLGSSTNPFTNWTELKAYLEMTSDAATDIYVQGPLGATESATIHRPVTIIPVGDVTITRTAENTNYIFNVNKNLTLQGSENNQFILQGNSETENSYPLINCTTSNVELNLQYCTLQNANCGNSNYASAIFVENDEEESILINMTNCKIKHNIGTPITIEATVIINLENCTFSNNTATTKASVIYIDSSDGNEDIITINNCNFANNTNISSKCGYLTLEDSNQISIINSDFDSCTTGYNIYISRSKSLTLDGQISIPKIYFNNDEEGRLAINVGTNLSLKDSLIPLTLYAHYYREVGDINNDCIFFNLENGQTLPDGVFALANSTYILNSDGTITEATTGGGNGGGSSDGTIRTLNDLANYYDSTNECYKLSTGEYIFGDNLTLDKPLYIFSENEVTIKSNTNVTITSSFTNDNLIYVEGNNNTWGSLTLGGGNGTLTLKHQSDNFSTISSSGQFILKDNCSITESKYCAINIYNGNFYMYGGKIYDNKYTGTNTQSAAITLYFDDCTDTCSAELLGGEIYNNETSSSGGGISYVKEAIPYIELNGVKIYNNKAGISGGGIYSECPIYITTSSQIYDNYINGIKKGASIDITEGFFYLDYFDSPETPYTDNIK